MENCFDTHCGYCGQEMLSILSAPGECRECGAPLCIECWTIRRRRLCRNHEGEISLLKNSAPAQNRCGKCGRPIPDDSAMGGQCENASCRAALCSRCWEEEHFCKIHLSTLEEKMGKAKELLQRGEIKCLVDRETAKAREMNFIGRFDLKLSRPLSLTVPLSRKKYTLKMRSGSHLISDDKDRLRKASGGKLTGKQIEETLPLNIRSRYEIAPLKLPSFAGIKGKVVIEAFSFSHPEAYLKEGFDTDPVSLSELVSIINNYTRKAEQENGYYIVGIVSPTGWEREARAYIGSEEGKSPFANRCLSLCLLDGETGELSYNRSDERILPFLDLFALELESEKVERCVSYVKDRLALVDHISREETVEKLRIRPEIAKAAFEKLAREGNFIVDDIKGTGLVISSRRA